MLKLKTFQLFLLLACYLIIMCSETQLYVTLCDPADCSTPGSSVHGISQARILVWVAISSRGIFLTQGWNPCLLSLLPRQVCSLYRISIGTTDATWEAHLIMIVLTYLLFQMSCNTTTSRTLLSQSKRNI